jgi:peptidoglycan/LPS O-acetylase OafA/YrhL
VSSKRPFIIPSLDGIRALSFLVVFISHDHLEQIPGLFGVAVFFFLSGYLITTLMRMEVESTGTLSLKNFYIRRSFRILPPFYVVLTLILVVVALHWLPGSYTGTDLAASAFYLTNYWNIYVRSILMPGFNVFWSLAVEEHFYLVFPLIVLVMLKFKWKRQTQAAILLGLCGVVLIWRCILVFKLHSLQMTFGPVLMPLRTMYGTDTRIDSILFGSVLALWGNPILDEGPKPRWSWTIGGILLLLMTFVYRSPEFRETFRYTVQGIALIPLFIAAIRWHEHPAFRWLDSAPLKFIGILSYTLYLVHFPALILVERWTGNRLIVGVVALALSIVVAYAVHILIEEPCARLRRRFGSRTADVLDPIREAQVGKTVDGHVSAEQPAVSTTSS